MLADGPFTKALRIFETCVLVKNNLCRKLFSSIESPPTFVSHFILKQKNKIRILLPFSVKNLKLFL